MTTRPYTRAQKLPEISQHRIMVLDGTMIQRFRLGEAQYRGKRFKDFHRDVKVNNELLGLTRPDVIASIHEIYLTDGADLIETDTFGATRVAQTDYDMVDLTFATNLATARIARATLPLKRCAPRTTNKLMHGCTAASTCCWSNPFLTPSTPKRRYLPSTSSLKPVVNTCRSSVTPPRRSGTVCATPEHITAIRQAVDPLAGRALQRNMFYQEAV